MKLICLKIYKNMIEDIEKLVKSGEYVSRSEVFRFAIRDLVRNELKYLKSDYPEDEKQMVMHRVPKVFSKSIMVSVSLKLPLRQVESLNELVIRGLFSNRSEAIRVAMYNLLQDEFGDMAEKSR